LEFSKIFDTLFSKQLFLHAYAFNLSSPNLAIYQPIWLKLSYLRKILFTKNLETKIQNSGKNGNPKL